MEFLKSKQDDCEEKTPTESDVVIEIFARRLSSTDVIRKASQTHIAITSEPEKEFPEDALSKESFNYNLKGLTSIEAAELLKKYGPNELPGKYFCNLLPQKC